MPEYLSPGVYIEEIATGPVPIEGVSTSTAGFLGETERGPVYPRLVTSWLDYVRAFGDYFGKDKYMPYSVKGFFDNGGKRCFVGRITKETSKAASIKLIDKEGNPAFTVNAAGEGGWGNKVAVEIGDASMSGFSLKVYCWKSMPAAMYIPTYDTKTYPRPDVSETFDNLSIDEASQDYIMYRVNGLSNLITVSKEKGDTGMVPSKVEGTVKAATQNTITLEDSASSTEDIYRNMYVLITEGKGKGQLREITGYDKTRKATVKPDWGEQPGGDKSKYIVCEFYMLDGGDDGYNKLLIEEGTVPEQTKSPEPKQQSGNLNRDNSAESAASTSTTTEITLNLEASDTGGFYTGMIISFAGDEHIITNYIKDTKKATIDPGLKKLPDAGSAYKIIEKNNQLVPGNFEGKQKNDNNPTSTGLAAFEEIDEISIVYSPNCTSIAGLPQALIAHCEKMKYRFLVFEPTQNEAVQNLNPRNDFETEYAAFYYPWIEIVDPGTGSKLIVPPGGHVAGVYARSDVERGVYKAPANEKIVGATGLFMQVSTGQQDFLNPRGVNVIRFFTGRGILVWGGRTLSGNTLWKYINVRRLFSYVEKSIYEGTQWVVFEPNNERLWDRVKQTISAFLTGVWLSGALMGTKPEEAFYITIDRSSMTQDDINNGRLIGIIGLAPVRPAEFVIFRFTQITASAI